MTIAAEVLGGVALILGFQTRLAALALTPVLLGAIATVHGPAGFFFDNAHGGWEYPAFWTVALVVQALLGDGAYALGSLRTSKSARPTRPGAFPINELRRGRHCGLSRLGERS